MLFDIRTPDTAFDFLQEFLGITYEDFIDEYVIKCDENFDKFWYRWVDHINTINIDDLEFIVFHVTSNDNNCLEIKTNGIKNLQFLLSENTGLNSFLIEHGIQFDIENKILYADKKEIDIDYEKYRGRFDLTSFEKKLELLAHKIYYDYQVNGFFSKNNITNYGTDIHKRPEFIKNIIESFPQFKKIQDDWIQKSKGYIVTYHATFDQFAWFSFYEKKETYIDDLSNKLQLKKWMLLQIVYRSFEKLNSNSEVFAYMGPEIIILPEQIIDYQEIKYC